MSEAFGPLDLAARAGFYVVAGVTLAGAWFTVSARNLFRAALGLAVALFGVAALYLFLEAEFLAVTQLLVYVGAILTLIIFGVMLTARIADPNLPPWNQQMKGAFLLSVAVGAGLIYGCLNTPWKENAFQQSWVTLYSLGRSLISIYLLPFELLSILLLGALVGAIVIARKD